MDYVSEKIKQRRAQMLVHSRLYYVLDESIVPDAVFDRWAIELRDLQILCPQEVGFFDSAFEDWTGATGCHLPLGDDWVVQKTDFILSYHKLNYT